MNMRDAYVLRKGDVVELDHEPCVVLAAEVDEYFYTWIHAKRLRDGAVHQYRLHAEQKVKMTRVRDARDWTVEQWQWMLDNDTGAPVYVTHALDW